MRLWIPTIGLKQRLFLLFLSVFLISYTIAFLAVRSLTRPALPVFAVDHTNPLTSEVKNGKNQSFICDRKRSNESRRELLINSTIDEHIFHALGPYCDIVPIPRQNWIPAQRYIESDIIFLIYTGAAFYHNRATAVRDTWLSRVTHKYFFSGTAYRSLPVTVIENAGENYLSNLKKLYLGMQLAFRKHNQTAKFYFLAGCDTFVNVPHLLKRLDAYDYRNASIIGGYPFEYKCYIKRNETSYKILYPSGGAGFFLSAEMMRLMQPKLNSYFENDWPLTEDKAYSDIAINCIAHFMDIKPTFVPGFWAFSPEQTLKDSGRVQLHSALEPNTFHYVHPLSMYILDEFYVHQLLDRLENDENFDELIKFTRQFVLAHYQLLRMKRAECTLPTIPQARK